MAMIKYKNLKIWFKEKTCRPKWYLDILSYRRFWGAFSICSHRRRSDGKPNISFSTQAKALKAVRSMEQKYGAEFTVYKCLYCDGWHVARSKPKVGTSMASTFDVALYKDPLPAALSAGDGLDHASIMATRVADLAPVYNGYRGRTLSSPRQAEAWLKLVSAGIRQVIDLRADYTGNIYEQLCNRYGVKYFHYPIAADDGSVASLVNGFPDFCRLMDEGHFYIACAMGLHRTDIALCLYWVFHAAEKGLPPPLLKGYIGRTPGRLGKLTRMLDLMQEHLTDHNKGSVLPPEVYMERKKVIEDILRKKVQA